MQVIKLALKRSIRHLEGLMRTFSSTIYFEVGSMRVSRWSTAKISADPSRARLKVLSGSRLAITINVDTIKLFGRTTRNRKVVAQAKIDRLHCNFYYFLPKLLSIEDKTLRLSLIKCTQDDHTPQVSQAIIRKGSRRLDVTSVLRETLFKTLHQLSSVKIVTFRPTKPKLALNSTLRPQLTQSELTLWLNPPWHSRSLMTKALGMALTLWVNSLTANFDLLRIDNTTFSRCAGNLLSYYRLRSLALMPFVT
eukprot:TRINITY_DN3272_c0_g2_i3.p1 TRINITY_DN3272_c0_g2~~TRINITY_DN3272_c0_g2_i3.p1  ORF type:complete len:251 (+),score=28.82 TRINITY_DN3272_c0_g2_i3:164-916(+)